MDQQNAEAEVGNGDDVESSHGSPLSIASNDTYHTIISDDEHGAKIPEKTDKAQNREKTEAESDSDSENQGCPICFEPWSNSGSHRLASLSCGHLFGRSCIEKWLKGKSTDKCPQCNAPAKRKDIRNIYCKALKVIDTTEKDRALRELEEERLKRSKAEEEHMRTKIQFEMARAELQRLREQVRQASLLQQQRLATVNERVTSEDSAGANGTRGTAARTFVFQKTIQVAQNKARVMAFDKTHLMISVSKPSPNQLFPGYGIVKVSSLEARSSEYVSIHQNTIRDICFNPRGDRLLLSASMDKSLRLTSMTSNTVVQCYNCPSPVWSCCWNDFDTNFVNAGLQNGKCLVFDIRKTNEALKSFNAIDGASCPIISMVYAPKCPGSDFCAEGLFVCTLNGGCFWEICRDSHFISHPLSLSPGLFSGLAFDDVTRCILASYRPSKFHASTRHMVYKMSGQGVDSSADNSLCSCCETRQLVGGKISKVLSRAALFSYSDDTDCMYAAVGDEASNSTLLWNCHTGSQLQKLPSSEIVLDIIAFSSQGRSFLSTLTEKKLSVYRLE